MYSYTTFVQDIMQDILVKYAKRKNCKVLLLFAIEMVGF